MLLFISLLESSIIITSFGKESTKMPSIAYSRPAPPTVVGPTTKKATRPTIVLPQFLIDRARVIEKEDFDPNKHLVFQPPKGITTMKEIGLEGHGISPIAASEPFPLFSQEAIRQIRGEIFSEPVLRDCQYSSSFAKNMVRGMGREYVSTAIHLMVLQS